MARQVTLCRHQGPSLRFSRMRRLLSAPPLLLLAFQLPPVAPVALAASAEEAEVTSRILHLHAVKEEAENFVPLPQHALISPVFAAKQIDNEKEGISVSLQQQEETEERGEVFALSSLAPNSQGSVVGGKKLQGLLASHQEGPREEPLHAPAAGAPGSTWASPVAWGEKKRLGFGGRPSCPAQGASADERRGRAHAAAAAAGRALLDSQLQQQQQRWLLLQQQQRSSLAKGQQQQQQQQQVSPSAPSSLVAGGDSERLNKGDNERFRDEGSRQGRPQSFAASQKTSKGDEGLTLGVPKGPLGRRSSPDSFVHAETPQETSGSCPREPPFLSLLLALSEASACPRWGDAEASARPARLAASASGEERQNRKGGDGIEGLVTAAKMQRVAGGFEAQEEETIVSSTALSLLANRLNSFLPVSASAPAGSRGAAIGQGAEPLLTWVLGDAAEESDPVEASFEEGQSLLEAFEYTFALHAEDVAREARELGLLTPGHAPAGAPQLATLQFNFDSVPLHEQRVIRAELNDKKEEETPWPAAAAVGSQLTPAQVQLMGPQGPAELSLAENGVGGLHAASLFSQLVTKWEGPEGAAALEVFSLSLDELRIILALQEEAGGPVSLVTAEDWGDTPEFSHFLMRAGQGRAFSFSWGEELASIPEEETEEEPEDDPTNSEDIIEDNYWHWLVGNPGAW